MNLEKKIYKEVDELNSIFKNFNIKSLRIFSLLCKYTLRAMDKNKILFCGNGGSAADAQHLATELVVKYKKKRKALPAIALSTDTSILTAVGNDYDFKNIFSRQIDAIGKKGDVLLLITTSGNSLNLIEALKVAKKKEIHVFCFSGNNGGKIKRYLKNIIIIPSKNTSLIQVIEIFLGQILCDYVETNFKKQEKNVK